MNKLTAAQARELAGPTIEERVQIVLDQIREVANPPTRARQIALHDAFWVNGGYDYGGTTELGRQYREACALLRQLGFRVEFYYKEMNIAVDMYTIVKW